MVFCHPLHIEPCGLLVAADILSYLHPEGCVQPLHPAPSIDEHQTVGVLIEYLWVHRIWVLRLLQKPVTLLTLQGPPDLFHELEGINTPVQILVYVGALVGRGQQVVEPPQADVTLLIPAERAVPVVVPDNKGKLGIG